MKHPPPNHDDHAFDDAMRALHAQSLERISPNTRLRLRPARRTTEASRAPARPAFGWVLATGCAAVFALAIGLQLRGPTPATSPATEQPLALADTTASAFDDSVAVLDENPDLYLWLAANDEPMPALE
ncbi:hypothetical protein ACFQZQ_11630 [Lysobacter koreensis]|uniref:Uncharacterized protein n=1 Tax=Lysobacter koreensis TaxID=266122 RepID=A0ABW2YNY8_9GAMM